MLGAVAAFERDVLIERTRAGMTAAKKRGIHVGRPITLGGERLDVATTMLAEGRSKRETARILRVSVDTLNRAIARKGGRIKPQDARKPAPRSSHTAGARSASAATP